MKTIQIQKRRRKTMNKKEVEGIEKVIKEYLKKNLRIKYFMIISQDIQDTTSLREVKYIQGGMLMVRVY